MVLEFLENIITKSDLLPSQFISTYKIGFLGHGSCHMAEDRNFREAMVSGFWSF